jgi:hypothetical protein
MIITKEQQETWIDAYIKQGHSQDECIGFIDGVEKVMSIVKNCNTPAVSESLPDWYKTLSLLELQIQALQEDIPRNLVERRGDVKDLETFDMKLTTMRNRLHRAFEELKGNVA